MKNLKKFDPVEIPSFFGEDFAEDKGWGGGLSEGDLTHSVCLSTHESGRSSCALEAVCS